MENAKENLVACVHRRQHHEILAALREWKPARIFDGWMQYRSPGWSRVRLEQLVTWLIERANSASAAQAVSELERYVHEEESECLDVMPVAALQVDETVQLHAGMTIVPGGEGLHSSMGRNLLKKAGAVVKTPDQLSCIVRRRAFPRIHLEPGQEPPASNPEYPGRQDLDDVRVLASLASSKAPLSVGGWTEFPPHIPAWILGGGIAHMRSQAYMVRNVPEPAELQRLHEAWCGMSGKRRMHFRVPLTRYTWTVSRGYRSELGATAPAMIEAAIDL